MKQKKREVGFSLIEMMLSALILGFAITIATSQYFYQTKTEGSANLEDQGRALLSQIATRVSINPAQYPPIVDSSGKPISYIECYNTKGIPRKNKNGNATAEASFLANPTVSTDYCNSHQETGFEMHISSAGAGKASLDMIILSSQNRDITSLKNTLHVDLQLEPKL